MNYHNTYITHIGQLLDKLVYTINCTVELMKNRDRQTLREKEQNLVFVVCLCARARVLELKKQNFYFKTVLNC